jgi:DNA modification methylase
MKPKISEENIFKLHNCDVRNLNDVLIKYGCNRPFVDVTITSPPYHDLKSYGFANQIGYGQEYSKYLEDVTDVFKQIYDITNDSGSLWIIVDTFAKDGTIKNLPFEICEKLKPQTDDEKGWLLKDVIIWKKDKTLPWSRKGQLRNIFEYVLFFTKSKKYKFHVDKIRVFDPSELKEWWVKFPERYNPKGAVLTNVWEYPILAQGRWGKQPFRHLNPLPIGMIDTIISLTTDGDDVVFDPFAGSGTVLAVANYLGRRWFGFEMNHEYCVMFKKKVLPRVKKVMSIKEGRRNELEALRKRFEETIQKLRLNKFPRALIRELLKRKSGSSNLNWINTIFAISKDLPEFKISQLPRNKFLAEDIFIVVDHPFDSSSLVKQIEEAVSSSPLSKFGIDPTIFIISRDEFILKKETSLENSEFWLYSGSFHKFEKQITFSEWCLESLKPEWKRHYVRGVPPIVSNIKVNQKVPKTWKSKDEKFKELKSSLERRIGFT